jgi:spore germination cell wall hydrolase CwlJ-like protein
MILTAAAATCLALNVYFEARNQDTDGQILVAEVTMNRVADDRFPDEICAVVWQNKAFSWTHDGKSDVPKNIEAWLKAQIVSYEVLLNGCDFCNGATHYHALSVNPYWSDKLTPVGTWGGHKFYIEEAQG